MKTDLMKTFLVIFLLCLVVEAEGQNSSNWLKKVKQIAVFVSTRSDVERLFDSPPIVRESDKSITENNGWGMSVTYETSWGELEAEYSTGDCSQNPSKTGYNVQKKILTNFTFWPDELKSPESFWFDIRHMKRETPNDVADVAVYYDFNSGLRVNVVRGKVKLIEYFPSKSQENLLCKTLQEK